MTFSQTLRLLFIAAIWGASHVLVRSAVPSLGPLFTAASRIAIASVTLLIYQRIKKVPLQIRQNYGVYILVGALYTAIPFSLFAYASVVLPSGYLVILNATVPLFSALFSSLILGDTFDTRKQISLLLGLSGVMLLKEFGSVAEVNSQVVLAMLMGLTASMSYGVAGTIVKKYGSSIHPVALTTAGSWVALFLMTPVCLYALPGHRFNFEQYSWHWVLLAVGILGVFGSAIAFVIFYGLIGEIGVFKTSLSTFLMPLFGLGWGMLLLGETLTQGMVFGAVLVISSAALFMVPKRR